jgi:DNA invertase Pin-like site-specific DNA recombinase
MSGANGHGPKKAILYARVSTDEQARSGYSLAQQLEALKVYTAREGYEVLEEVSDPGQSGASLERPGMDRIRDLVAEGGVSVVLAQDRDRFSREPAYHYLLRQEFEETGCMVKALNDRGDGSPEGELTDGLLDQIARYERAKVAQRSQRGKLRRSAAQRAAWAAHGLGTVPRRPAIGRPKAARLSRKTGSLRWHRGIRPSPFLAGPPARRKAAHRRLGTPPTTRRRFERDRAPARHFRDSAAYGAALDLYAGELLPEDRHRE